MFKKATLIFALILTAAGFVCAKNSDGKLEIIATLFPTYDFAVQIGGNKANVYLILPAGMEPHTFEPKSRDIVKINKSDIFIYTGKYMEPWVEDLLKGIPNKNLKVVDASFGIKLLTSAKDDGDHKNHDTHQHHGQKDPHIWLDFANAQIMADTIAQALVEKDPQNKDFYLKNALQYKNKLADLDKSFKQTLATAKHKTIIYGGHFAFGYFTKRYGLKYESPYNGFSPNAEPSPKAIGELIKKLKASEIKYIYYEELIDPKVARTISQATGAKLELLHAAHNISKSDIKKGITFINIMQSNLEKLKEGLECRQQL